MPEFSHESVYEEAYRKGEFPGAALVAADATGKFRYAKAIGKTAAGEDFAMDSVMWIASCTKIMTSVAALQQVERGNIGLDDDVAPWLPELAAQEVLEGFDSEDRPILKKRQEKITLRYLLTCPRRPDSAPFWITDLLTSIQDSSSRTRLESLIPNSTQD